MSSRGSTLEITLLSVCVGIFCPALLEAEGNLREDDFLKTPWRYDDQAYADIDGNWMKQVLLELNSISLDNKASGRLFWGRNLGTQANETVLSTRSTWCSYAPGTGDQTCAGLTQHLPSAVAHRKKSAGLTRIFKRCR